MTSFDGLNGFNKIFNFTTLMAMMNAWAITKSSVFWQQRESESVSVSDVRLYRSRVGGKNLRVNSFEDNVNTSSA